MSERKGITVKVLYQDQYGSGPFDFGSEYTDGSLDRVIASLQRIRDSIPEEYRKIARCEIEAISRYESAYASIAVNYPRLETDEELTARLAAADARAAEIRTRELAELERLKAKYAAPSRSA